MMKIGGRVTNIHAKSNTEKIGDFLSFAIPATSYASTWYFDDEEGHQRYGLEYALPLYVGAIYTGYSRIHVNRHHPRDVAAGAIIGGLWAWYFTEPNEKFHISPTVDSAYKGVQISYNF